MVEVIKTVKKNKKQFIEVDSVVIEHVLLSLCIYPLVVMCCLVYLLVYLFRVFFKILGVIIISLLPIINIMVANEISKKESFIIEPEEIKMDFKIFTTKKKIEIKEE